jgi:hypothetical protein
VQEDVRVPATRHVQQIYPGTQDASRPDAWTSLLRLQDDPELGFFGVVHALGRPAAISATEAI